MKYVTTINSNEFTVDVLDDHHVLINNQVYQVDFHPVSDQPVYSLLIDGKSYEAYVYPVDDAWQVLLFGNQYSAQVEDEREHRLRSAKPDFVQAGSEFHLKAPMPGLVVLVAVEDGQKIQKGDVLVILESMKMQNELKSPRDGIVTRIRISSGESVEQRQIMLSVV
jgi:biotin carboxyl carrier protein